MNSKCQKLVEILQETRQLLSLPDNDFAWSSWDDAPAALREIDGIIARIESGDMPPRAGIELLFLATGPIQEVSVSSGWGHEFLKLADRFDNAIARAYGDGVFSQLNRLLPGRRKIILLLRILAVGLPILAYCAAFQTGNIGVAVRDNIGEGPAKIGLVFPGSPADRAGVKTNWIILSIDGNNMLGTACTNCMQRLHGTVGTSVTLELVDPQNHQTNSFTIKREDVPLPENLFREFLGTNAPKHQAPYSSSFLIAH
jgi:hypothetical protein